MRLAWRANRPRQTAATTIGAVVRCCDRRVSQSCPVELLLQFSDLGANCLLLRCLGKPLDFFESDTVAFFPVPPILLCMPQNLLILGLDLVVMFVDIAMN